MEKSSGVYSFDIFFLSREEDGGRVVTQLVLGYVNTHTHNCFYWLAIQPKKTFSHVQYMHVHVH